MPLPTLEKTPQFVANGEPSLNRYFPSTGSNTEGARALLLGIKQCLTGFASSPWEVVRSSNSLAAGGPGEDLWNTPGDLVFSTTVGSWIVLSQPGLGLQLLLHLSSTQAYNLRAIISFAGFTGGTTSARPTAVDEVQLRGGDTWLPAQAVPFVFHAMQSTDGSYTHVLICTGGYTVGWWSFQRVADPSTAVVAGFPGWPNPVVASLNGASSTTTSLLTHTLYNAGTPFKAYAAGGQMDVVLTEVGHNGKGLTDFYSAQANELSGEWPMPPVGVASPTVGRRGPHGRLVDIWWGGSLHQEGTTYPMDGTRRFAQFGHFIFPWDGSVPRTV